MERRALIGLNRLKVDRKTELRRLDPTDAPFLFELVDRNRAHLRRWLPWVDGSKTARDSLEFIRNAQSQYCTGKEVHCGIWHNGCLVGVIGVHHMDWGKKETALGYWIAEDFQGQGIITKSCRVIVDFLMRRLKLKRILLRCAPENVKSRAVAERLGFRPGVASQPGVYQYEYLGGQP